MPSRRDFHKLSIAAVSAAALPAAAQVQNAPPASIAAVPAQRIEDIPVLRAEMYGTHGLVSGGCQYTVEAGTRMLAAGGNAFDAGVAAVFAAAVTEISHFGLGGEANTIVFQAGSGKVTVGLRPGHGAKGGEARVFPRRRHHSRQWAQRRHDTGRGRCHGAGTAELRHPVAGAGDGAGHPVRGGLSLYGIVRRSLLAHREATVRWDWSRRTYYPEGRIPDLGEMFRQPNLAATLRTIVAAERTALASGASRVDAIKAGRDAFYKGDVARRIAAAVQADNGLLSYEDLASYQGKLEPAVSTRFQGYDIHKCGFWSQGPALLMTLNILEAAGIEKLRHGSEPYTHTLIEAIKLAFDDRNAWFGDPLFAKIPAEGLLSKSYATERAALISAEASLQHRFGNPWPHQRDKEPPVPTFLPHRLKVAGPPTGDTTAVEVVDAAGNLFSCTPSSGWLIGGATSLATPAFHSATA